MSNLSRRHFLASITLPLLAARDEVYIKAVSCVPPYIEVIASLPLLNKFNVYFVSFQDKHWRTNPALNWALEINTFNSHWVGTAMERAAALYAIDKMRLDHCKVVLARGVYDVLSEEKKEEAWV